MALTSVKPTNEVYSVPPTFLPKKFTLSNFQNAWIRIGNGRFFLNSSIVSFSTTLLGLPLSLMMGYALSRYRFRGKGLCSNLVLISQLAPPVLLVIPLYFEYVRLNLIDTYSAPFLTYNSFAIPLGTWSLMSYIDMIPRDIEDAARVDGATTLDVILRIVFPLAMPGIIAVGFFISMLSWIEFTFAYTFINADYMRTLTAGIAASFGSYFIDWIMLIASGMIITIPPSLIFLYFQKYLIAGLLAGATKA